MAANNRIYKITSDGITHLSLRYIKAVNLFFHRFNNNSATFDADNLDWGSFIDVHTFGNHIQAPVGKLTGPGRSQHGERNTYITQQIAQVSCCTVSSVERAAEFKIRVLDNFPF